MTSPQLRSHFAQSARRDFMRFFLSLGVLSIIAVAPASGQTPDVIESITRELNDGGAGGRLVGLNRGGQLGNAVFKTETLGALIEQSESIVHLNVTQVVRSNTKKSSFRLQQIKALKGEGPKKAYRLTTPKSDPASLRAVREWAKLGEEAVAFIGPHTITVCTGRGWFMAIHEKGSYRLEGISTKSTEHFSGSVSELCKSCAAIMNGKQVVIPAIAPGNYVHWGWGLPSNSYVSLLRSPGRTWQIAASSKIINAPRSDFSKNFVAWGRGADESLADLVERTDHAQLKVRLQALDDLADRGSPAISCIPALKKLFRDPDFRIQLAAAQALRHIDPVDPAPLKVWRRGLCDLDEADRWATWESLQCLGPLACDAAADALRTLKRESTLLPHGFAAIAVIGPTAPKEVRLAILRYFVTATDHAFRGTAVFGRFGRDCLEILPEVEEAVHQSGASENLTQHLCRLGPAAEATCLRLIECGGRQAEVLNSLVANYYPSDAAISFFEGRLADPDLSVRIVAAVTLLQMNPECAREQSLPVLQDIAEHAQDDQLKHQALNALAGYENKGRRAACANVVMPFETSLLPMLRDPTANWTNEVQGYLRQRGNWTMINEELRRELATTKLPIKARLAYTLWHTDPPSASGRMRHDLRPQLLAVLKGVLSDKKSAEHSDALIAIEAIGPAAVSLVREILPFLMDCDSSIQSLAISALQQIGRGARGRA